MFRELLHTYMRTWFMLTCEQKINSLNLTHSTMRVYLKISDLICLTLFYVICKISPHNFNKIISEVNKINI